MQTDNLIAYQIGNINHTEAKENSQRWSPLRSSGRGQGVRRLGVGGGGLGADAAAIVQAIVRLLP